MDLTQKSQNEKWEIISTLIKKGYLAHGGTKMFNEFDPKHIQGGCRGEYGYGFYFSNEAYKPIEYGGHFYFTKQDIYNFCNLNNIQTNPLLEFENKIVEAEYGLDNATNNKQYEYYTEMYEKYSDLNEQEKLYLHLFNYAMKKIKYEAKNAIKYAIGNAPSYFNPKYLSNLFLKLGYDGIIAENQFVIFNFEKLNKNLLKIELNNYDEFMNNQIEEKRKEFKSILEKIENVKYGK